ncbi:prepilin peptidase [Paenibacillus sp. HJL G12]|uniref:Prepilin peptidase n=1 Tax=Paenibacillus dendrobii TaxID=2691084 RepID=A0A7X3IPR0_9BACL|nr:A24 family peptidase [Paenibacillus dendrobii]MWV46650.1 prepilin peptidase [Paenibacillus dendrobii]
MTLIISIYALICGMLLGSFYNVVGLRVPAGESIIHPPSHCTGCNTRLTARDLIPVVSYLLSRGHCRHCGVKVSTLYPLGEALTGLLFVWVILYEGISGRALIGLLLVSLTVIVTVADLKYMLIPNKVLLIFVPLLVAAILFFPEGSLWVHLAGAAVGGGITLLLASFGGMGMGDVKLFALCGWVLGLPGAMIAFLAACFMGTAVYGILLITGVIRRKQPVPFGPWLAAGTLLAYEYGSTMISGYLSLWS